MKTEKEDGKEITVFDDVEEMKWFFHALLCKDNSAPLAKHMAMNVEDAETANKFLKRHRHPYRVMEAES